METEASIQPCRLCLTRMDLRESHLLPRGLYKILQTDWQGRRDNKPPYHLSKKTATRSGKQIKKHLLCALCEQRLSAFGEKWVLGHCFRKRGDFLLQKILRDATPHGEVATGTIFHTSDLPGETWKHLAYFAVSVIWRASIDDWGEAAETGLPLQIDEADKERFRRYLLGDAEFPDNLLLVGVAASQSPAVQSMMLPCHSENQSPLDPRFHIPGYMFLVPGISFFLSKNTDISPQYYDDGCLVRGTGHPVLMMNTDAEFTRPRDLLMSTAVPSELLIQDVESQLGIPLRRKQPKQSSHQKNEKLQQAAQSRFQRCL